MAVDTMAAIQPVTTHLVDRLGLRQTRLELLDRDDLPRFGFLVAGEIDAAAGKAGTFGNLDVLRVGPEESDELFADVFLEIRLFAEFGFEIGARDVAERADAEHVAATGEGEGYEQSPAQAGDGRSRAEQKPRNHAPILPQRESMPTSPGRH